MEKVIDKISEYEYGQKHQRLTWRDIADKLDGVILCNSIARKDLSLNCGSLEEDNEFYQYYLIAAQDADYLKYLNEEYGSNFVVMYCHDIDVYVWCIPHVGTGWDYVLTSIKTKEC